MSSQVATRPAPTAGPPQPPAGRSATVEVVAAVAAAALGILALMVLALVVGGGRPAPAATGLPDAGNLTGWGLPVARLTMRVAAVGAVGALLYGAVLCPSRGGRIPPKGLRAVRSASWWALAWAAAAGVTGVLTVSSLYGVPVSALTPSALAGFVTGIDSGRAAAGALALTVVVAVAARRCSRTATAALLLVLGLGAVVLPSLLAGHSATAPNHALAVTSLSVHVLAATLWVGGLLALVVHGRGSAALLASTAARYSMLALACFAAAGSSGLLNAWLLLGAAPGSLGLAMGTGYGWLLMAKTAALLALGVLGWWHRRRTLPQLADARSAAFRRLAAVEVVVMLGAVALAVALAASPPPAPAAPPSTPGQTTAGPGTAPAAPTPGPTPSSEDMSGHDHGELSVGVFIDGSRFHVSGPVSPGQPVTVYNESTTEVSITADDGSFDAVVRGQTLTTITAPDAPGEYPFASRHAASFRDVLVVR